MGGNYNAFAGRWEACWGGAFPRYVAVADMRKTTRPTSSGLLWFFLIHRLLGDPSNIIVPTWDITSAYSLSVGEKKSVGSLCPEDEHTIWEIWIGEVNYQLFGVVSVSGNSMVLGRGGALPLYPDGLRYPRSPATNQYAGTHLRKNGVSVAKIVSNTTGAPFESWSLTVGEGINLADYYSPGGEAMIVPLYSGRDISVMSLPEYDDHPRPFQRG